MAYTIDQTDGSIVIGGFQQGIGDSPYTGLTDVKGMNISSISSEASVAFATASVIKTPRLTNNTAATIQTSSNLFIAPSALLLENNVWITFSVLPGGSGLATATPYKLSSFGVSGANEQYQLLDAAGSIKTITANGSVTFSTIVPSAINFFQKSIANNFAIDANGRVWSDVVLSSGAGFVPSTSSWTYLGNTTFTDSKGNGLLLYTSVHNGTGGGGTQVTFDEWLFVFRNSAIDYYLVTSGNVAQSVSWLYGWKPSTGTTGNNSPYLNTNGGVAASHHSLITPDGRANFCDSNYLQNFYQNVPSVGTSYTGFNPADSTTYTFQTYTAIVPPDDVAQCLAFVNQYLLIGGKKNIIYPWNLSPSSNTYSTPLILLPEPNIQAMLTVGNNTYIFAGNRGNIYVTNGSQASFFKKVPDHVSGSVEPLFQWGAIVSSIGISPQCATYSKNRLYFGTNGSYQKGGNLNYYGGIWCLDLVAQNLSQVQQMSYGTWNGSVTALMAASSDGVVGPSIGYGLIAGWDDGLGNYGIDGDIRTPYINGSSRVTSELIPVGTLLKPHTSTQIEIKLSTPLVAGESITVYQGSYLDMSYASFATIGTMTYSSSDASLNLSYNWPIQQQNQQWCIVSAVATSVNTSPSYCRITEMRIVGGAVKSTSLYAL